MLASDDGFGEKCAPEPVIGQTRFNGETLAYADVGVLAGGVVGSAVVGAIGVEAGCVYPVVGYAYAVVEVAYGMVGDVYGAVGGALGDMVGVGVGSGVSVGDGAGEVPRVPGVTHWRETAPSLP